jgi:hypothetical protein
MLFGSVVGTSMDAHNFNNRVMAPSRDTLKLPVLAFQVLRRSHATGNQSTPRDAQAHRGHKQITTTLGIYEQEVPATVKAMVEADETAILSASELIAPKSPPRVTERSF